MNILIIGGLLGLAVLAVLGAVLLGLSEDRADKVKKGLVAQQASTPGLLPPQAQSRQAVSQGPAYPSIPAYQSVPATPILPPQTIPLPVPSTDEATTGSLHLSNLNGQVREISSELRTLAQRAGELQQRLTTLSETLENQVQPYPEPPRASVPADLFTSDTETQVL